MNIPSQDMIIGVYYLTQARVVEAGEDMALAGFDDALRAYDCRAEAGVCLLYTSRCV